jgi:hypothetical protein
VGRRSTVWWCRVVMTQRHSIQAPKRPTPRAYVDAAAHECSLKTARAAVRAVDRTSRHAAPPLVLVQGFGPRCQDDQTRVIQLVGWITSG